MIKKAVVILLLVIYAPSSFGVGIQQFYCCGKLKSTSIAIDNFKKVGCDKGDGKTGCCKTTFQYLKIKDSYVTSDGTNIPIATHSDLYISQYDILFDIVKLPNEITVNGRHDPPRTCSIPIYISNRVFRI